MLTLEEKSILEEISFEEPKMLLYKFNNLIRQSGSEDERKAAYYIGERLAGFGMDYEILWPEIYLSTPVKAELKIIGQNEEINVKTPSYSMSTGDKWVDGELIYASSYRPPYATDEFEYKLRFESDPKGKIVICDGIPSPDKVNDIISNKGVAAIFVQSGERIHEGICTSVWGSPGYEDLANINRIPVVSVNKPDGKRLIESLKENKVRAALRTLLDDGWKKCPLVLTKILGCESPEKFILLHGHIDSWHKGIGDNALGNATMLEIARVLQNNRSKLKKSVWIAWWPGHSTGRYAGSTWFADQFAMEFHDNCIAQVNCKSTGCVNANTYDGIMWTEEMDDFCRQIVVSVTGIEPKWTRPHRAGDYSFNNIGISSFFMLSSTMSREKMEKLGYYEVYGCGGNIEWHTENDDMSIVDEKIFLRDTKLYLAGIYKMVNEPLLPVNIKKLLESMRSYLHEYQTAAGDSFDFGIVFDELRNLELSVEEFYDKVGEYRNDSQKSDMICNTILRIVRKLIRINYTSRQEFRHDPAAMMPPIPDLAPVLMLNSMSNTDQKFLVTQLVRARNRVLHALKECRQIIMDVSL